MKKNNTTPKTELELAFTAQKGGKDGLDALNQLLETGAKARKCWARRAYELHHEYAHNLTPEDYEQEAFFADRERILSYNPSKGAALRTHRINGIRSSMRQMAKKDSVHCIREKSWSVLDEQNPFEGEKIPFEETCSKDFRSTRLVDNEASSIAKKDASELHRTVMGELEIVKDTAQRNEDLVTQKRIDRVEKFADATLHGKGKKDFCNAEGFSRTTLNSSLETAFKKLSKEAKKQLQAMFAA